MSNRIQQRFFQVIPCGLRQLFPELFRMQCRLTGVMVNMRPGQTVVSESGWREACCSTLAYCDADGKRLVTREVERVRPDVWRRRQRGCCMPHSSLPAARELPEKVPATQHGNQCSPALTFRALEKSGRFDAAWDLLRSCGKPKPSPANGGWRRRPGQA